MNRLKDLQKRFLAALTVHLLSLVDIYGDQGEQLSLTHLVIHH